jgi:hypothetical protein
MRLAGCGPYLAIRYGGRAARRMRHLVAEGGPQPPADQETTARFEARQRTRRTAAGWAIALPVSESKGLIGENGAPSSALCVKGGSLSGAGFVIPLVGVIHSPARLLRELSNWTRLSRMGVFRVGSSVPRRHIQAAAVESGT